VHGAPKYKTKNKMNTLTNEQVGLQIAKQTINKLNKNMMVGYFKTKIWTGWNKRSIRTSK
jgi:hypothetical protein